MAIRDSVVIEICNNFASSDSQGDISGTAKPGVISANDPAIVLGCNGSGSISRSVINDNHVKVWVIELLHTSEALANGTRTVVAAHRHGDVRPSRVGWE